jgi:hypothetical protein
MDKFDSNSVLYSLGFLIIPESQLLRIFDDEDSSSKLV